MRRLLIALAMVAALTLGPAVTASAQVGGPGGGEQDRGFVAECIIPSEKLITIACVAIHLGFVLPRENAD